MKKHNRGGASRPTHHRRATGPQSATAQPPSRVADQVCQSCARVGTGKVDPHDKYFYCDNCWKDYTTDARVGHKKIDTSGAPAPPQLPGRMADVDVRPQRPIKTVLQQFRDGLAQAEEKRLTNELRAERDRSICIGDLFKYLSKCALKKSPANDSDFLALVTKAAIFGEDTVEAWCNTVSAVLRKLADADQSITARLTVVKGKEDLVQRAEAVLQELQTAKADLKEAKEDLDRAERALDRAKADLKEAKEDLDRAERALDRAKADLKEAKEDLDRAKADLDRGIERTTAELDAIHKLQDDFFQGKTTAASSERTTLQEVMPLKDRACVVCGRKRSLSRAHISPSHVEAKDETGFDLRNRFILCGTKQEQSTCRFAFDTFLLAILCIDIPSGSSTSFSQDSQTSSRRWFACHYHGGVAEITGKMNTQPRRLFANSRAMVTIRRFSWDCRAMIYQNLNTMLADSTKSVKTPFDIQKWLCETDHSTPDKVQAAVE